MKKSTNESAPSSSAPALVTDERAEKERSSLLSVLWEMTTMEGGLSLLLLFPLVVLYFLKMALS